MPQESREDAPEMLRHAGLSWSTSGECIVRKDRRRTAKEEIDSTASNRGIAFKEASGCDVPIRVGTEASHSSGTHRHWNGFEWDITPIASTGNGINFHSDATGLRRAGSSSSNAGKGKIDRAENHHWDITFLG